MKAGLTQDIEMADREEDLMHGEKYRDGHLND